MTGFKPQTSSIGSNRYTNWATTTAQLIFEVSYEFAALTVWPHLAKFRHFVKIIKNFGNI